MFCSHDLVINLPFYSSPRILLKVEICLFWWQESFSSGKLEWESNYSSHREYLTISLNVSELSDLPRLPSGNKKRFGWHKNPQLVHLFNRKWINKNMESYKIDFIFSFQWLTVPVVVLHKGLFFVYFDLLISVRQSEIVTQTSLNFNHSSFYRRE